MSGTVFLFVRYLKHPVMLCFGSPQYMQRLLSRLCFFCSSVREARFRVVRSIGEELDVLRSSKVRDSKETGTCVVLLEK